MKLILFGGIKGVGKTTLISWLENKFAGQIEVLNPGELFRRYFYEEKIKTAEEIERLIASRITEMPRDAVVVVHWHYAVRRAGKYIPQIGFPLLRQVAQSGKIEQVILLVAEAPIDAVLERRLANYQAKKRSLARTVISQEVAADEKFLIKHRILFSQALGAQNVSTVRLANTDLRAARLALCKLFNSLPN